MSLPNSDSDFPSNASFPTPTAASSTGESVELTEFLEEEARKSGLPVDTVRQSIQEHYGSVQKGMDFIKPFWKAMREAQQLSLQQSPVIQFGVSLQ
jgi:hypothetical protein